MQWKQELLFIKRDANGVIVAISERTPEGYVAEEKEDNSLNGNNLIQN